MSSLPGPAAMAAAAHTDSHYDPLAATTVHAYPEQKLLTLHTAHASGYESLAEFTLEQGRILAAAITRACDLIEGTTS